MENKTLDKMTSFMRYSLSVEGLKNILDELIKQGYGNSNVGFRLGYIKPVIPSLPPNAVAMPIADLRINQDKSLVLFTPCARIEKENGKYLPEFDIIVNTDDDKIELQIEELLN